MTDLIDWRTVSMTDGVEDIEDGLDPERIEALAEYRKSGCIDGVWLATTEEVESADEDGHVDGVEIAALGPSVSEIDWTGFDAAHAAYTRAVAAWGRRGVRYADDVEAHVEE